MIRWHIKTLWRYFLCSLVPDKKLSFSSNIYLLSLLLDQLYLGQYFFIQSEIKDLLKMEDIGTNHKGDKYVYASENPCSQINILVLKRDKVRKTKKKHAKKFLLDPYRETWKTSLSIFCSWRDDLWNCLRVVFITFCTYASCFSFIYAFVFIFNKRTYRCNYI